VRLTLKEKCPHCGSAEYVRIPRKSWMRIFKSSYLYECNLCRNEFILLQYDKDKVVPSLLKES
jgi:hypothetical protein